MYYCRECKQLFKDSLSKICNCGRKLNFTTDAYIDAYLNKGFVLAQCNESQTEMKNDREKELKKIKSDILHSMGVENYKELFNQERVIEQCIQEESNKENEKRKKEEEIWLKREQKKKVKLEQRQQQLSNNIDDLQSRKYKEDIFDVEYFLNSLGLKKKNNET